ncbi:MAG: peroxiredoxin [Myxococcota bacterium]|jgi:peroxiredoxin
MTRILSSLAVFPLLLAAGCQGISGDGGYASSGDFSLFPGGGDAGVSGDSDGDGLSDAEEAAIGSDPQVADTDGDGWFDGDEVDQYTDPTDKKDHPYQGGWAIGQCRHDLEGTGYAVGDVSMNFELKDQFGDTVKLHDFCDRVVLLVSSATWCGPCNEEAPEVGGWYDEYVDDGLMVITLLTENGAGSPPTKADLESWANTHGLGHPVVADLDWTVTAAYVNSPNIGIPTMQLLSPGGIVELTDDRADAGLIESALSAMK